MDIADKAKRAKAAYMKEWRKKHRDKIKSYQQRYWAKKYERQNEV